jgi:hypothetical protein
MISLILGPGGYIEKGEELKSKLPAIPKVPVLENIK